MANEITAQVSLQGYQPAAMSAIMSRTKTSTFNMAGNFAVQDTISVGITATAIPLGQVTAPHWAYFYNLDPTNYVTIRNGASGADLAQLKAGEFAVFPLLTTCTPYAVANTAPILMEYLILSL